MRPHRGTGDSGGPEHFPEMREDLGTRSRAARVHRTTREGGARLSQGFGLELSGSEPPFYHESLG